MAVFRCSPAPCGLLLLLVLAPELASSAQFDQTHYPAATALRARPWETETYQTYQGYSWLETFWAQGKDEPKIEVEDDAKGSAKTTAMIALLLFVVPPMIAITLTYCLPPCLNKESIVRRYYGYLFLAHRNAKFAENYELSVRGTVGVLILSIPFLFPQYGDLVKSGYYTSTAVMLFVFTLYKTVGDTVYLAWEGILGTFIAVLNIWIMNGIFPQGVHDEASDVVWYSSVIEGILYVLIIVGSDLDMGCKMFALNWHMFFWMDFLNPNVTGVYSAAWRINIKGPAISGLVQSCIGVGVAVLVTLLPFPLFALDKARDIALDVAQELSDSFDAGIACFVTSSKDQYAETKLRHEIGALSGNVSAMGAHAGSAWWECLGLPGKPQKVRDFIGELSDTTTEAYKRLIGIRHLCRVAERGSAEHAQLMEHVKPHLENLSKQTGDLLKTLAACAVDGSFDEDEKATIADLSSKVRESMKTLTTEFAAKKAEIKGDCFHQSAFCMSYCAYARIALDFESVLSKNIESGMFLDNVKDALRKFNIPILTDAGVRNEWLRSSLAILLCFLVGYRGYSAILPSYNATPAAVVSLLLSKGLTANASKNLARFQGVVLGIVFGQIAYALLGWCSTSGYIGVGIFLGIWSLSTFIMYYHLDDGLNQLIGCLLAAFGVVGVLRGCSDSVFEAGGSYNTVVGVVVAITIKVLVDSMLASARASEAATGELVSAWEQLESAMKDFFDPEVKVMSFKNGAISGTFASAASLSKNADIEPRLWWCLWKTVLFAEICESGEKMCESLSNLEAAFSRTGKNGGEKSSTLEMILKSEASQTLKDALLARFAGMKHICNEAFSYNKDGFFAAEYEAPKGLADFSALKKDTAALVSSLSGATGGASKSASDDTEIDTSANLEYDMNCKISVFYFTVEWMLELMDSTSTTLLSQ